MPRNEFKAGDWPLEVLQDLTDLELRDLMNAGKITRDDFRQARGIKTPAGERPEGSTDQESDPVEDASGDEGIAQPSPADYRRVPGLVTTPGHIAERYGVEDTPLR